MTSTGFDEVFTDWQRLPLERGIQISRSGGAYSLVPLDRRTGLPTSNAARTRTGLTLPALIIYLLMQGVPINASDVSRDVLAAVGKFFGPEVLATAVAQVATESLLERARQKSRPEPRGTLH